MQWLRHGGAPAEGATPRPVLRLRQLLQVLDQHPQHRDAVQGLLQAFWREIDIAALFAEFGFSPRLALRSALWQRLRTRLLPRTPVTRDLAALFPLLFEDADLRWLPALDDATLARAAHLPLAAAGACRTPRISAVRRHCCRRCVHRGGGLRTWSTTR